MARLFVGNIPHACDDVDLQSWFEQQGCSVDSVQIMRDRITGQSRGFGFVQLNNVSEPESIIENLNGQRLAGRVLTVGEAVPRTPQARIA